MDKVSRKGKKKHVKDELDRQKQAEKKRRRLEKALANSAAIRLELEKKKQMKIEEQQRLDEESAAIAEAVALQVLSGEDDGQLSHHFLIDDRYQLYNLWDHSNNLGFFMDDGYQSFEFASQSHHYQHYEETSAELMASLQIAEDEQADRISDERAASFVVNQMFHDL